MTRFRIGIDAGERLIKAKQLYKKAKENNCHISLRRVDFELELVELLIVSASRHQTIQLSFFDLYELRIYLPCNEVSQQTFIQIRDAISVVKYMLSRIATRDAFRPSSCVMDRLHNVLRRKSVSYVSELLTRVRT